MNAFAFFVDVIDRCAGAPLEAAAFLDTVVTFATHFDECIFSRGCERDGIEIGIDFAQVASIWGAIDDKSFGVRWRKIESHSGKLSARLGETGRFRFGDGSGCRGGGGWGIVYCDKLMDDANLGQKICSGFCGGVVMKCCECGVVGKGGVTFLIYLLEIFDKIFGVVAEALVLKYAKIVRRVSVVVLATAYTRAADTS